MWDLSSQLGMEPEPCALDGEVSTTEPPGKSLSTVLLTTVIVLYIQPLGAYILHNDNFLHFGQHLPDPGNPCLTLSLLLYIHFFRFCIHMRSWSFFFPVFPCCFFCCLRKRLILLIYRRFSYFTCNYESLGTGDGQQKTKQNWQWNPRKPRWSLISQLCGA